MFVDAGEDEAAFVEGFRTLGGCADADRREGSANRGEEGAFLGEGAAVRDDGKCVHLQIVVIVEAKRLVADDALIKLEAALVKSVSASRMAGVENGHIVLFCDAVDGTEEREEVLLGIDIFLSVCREEYVPFLLKSEACQNIRRINLVKICV